jgi:hypothetical protein
MQMPRNFGEDKGNIHENRRTTRTQSLATFISLGIPHVTRPFDLSRYSSLSALCWVMINLRRVETDQLAKARWENEGGG